MCVCVCVCVLKTTLSESAIARALLEWVVNQKWWDFKADIFDSAAHELQYKKLEIDEFESGEKKRFV